MQQQQQLQQHERCLAMAKRKRRKQHVSYFAKMLLQDAASFPYFLPPPPLVHASVTLHLSSRSKNKWKIVLKKLLQRGGGGAGERGEAAENECVLVSLFSLLVASGVGEIEGV